MASNVFCQLTQLMLFVLLGSHDGQGQTLLFPTNTNLLPTSDSSNKIQSNPITYPATPLYSIRLTTAMAQPPNPTTALTNILDQRTTIPTDPNPTQPFTRLKTEPDSTTPLPFLSTSLPQTTLLAVNTVLTTILPTGVSAPPSTPQHVQISFDNIYSDLASSDLDEFANRQNAQAQLTHMCSISSDRITDISIQPNSTGFAVLRFTIQQGYPVYTSQVVQTLKTAIQSQTSFMVLSGHQLHQTVAVFWTDYDPCPDDQCINGGLCNVDLSGSYGCQCSPGYTGNICQDTVTPGRHQNPALFALLVLLVIPIAVALAVGFYFGLRRQRRMQLKRAFDLRDVRTIGPKSMLSLPHEPGMRNQMYDTRSFALAFTDTSFGKSPSPPSSEEDLVRYMSN